MCFKAGTGNVQHRTQLYASVLANKAVTNSTAVHAFILFCSPVASVYSRSRITASRYLCLHAFHTSRDQTHNRQFRVSCPPDLDSYGRRGSATQQHCEDKHKHARQPNITFPLLHLMRALNSQCVFFNTSRDILQVTFFFFFFAIASSRTNSLNSSVQFAVH